MENRKAPQTPPKKREDVIVTHVYNNLVEKEDRVKINKLSKGYGWEISVTGDPATPAKTVLHAFQIDQYIRNQIKTREEETT